MSEQGPIRRKPTGARQTPTAEHCRNPRRWRGGRRRNQRNVAVFAFKSSAPAGCPTHYAQVDRCGLKIWRRKPKIGVVAAGEFKYVQNYEAKSASVGCGGRGVGPGRRLLSGLGRRQAESLRSDRRTEFI